MICRRASSKFDRVLPMVRGPLTATIPSIARCAAASLSFSIFSNAAMSGFLLHMGGCAASESCAAAPVALEMAMTPSRQRFSIRIDGPEVILIGQV